MDSRTGAKVAIKKLYRPFQSELFAKRAYRELRLLKHMRHENVSRPVASAPVGARCAPALRPLPAVCGGGGAPRADGGRAGLLPGAGDLSWEDRGPQRVPGPHLPLRRPRPWRGDRPGLTAHSAGLFSWKGHFPSLPATAAAPSQRLS